MKTKHLYMIVEGNTTSKKSSTIFLFSDNTDFNTLHCITMLLSVHFDDFSFSLSSTTILSVSYIKFIYLFILLKCTAGRPRAHGHNFTILVIN